MRHFLSVDFSRSDSCIQTHDFEDGMLWNIILNCIQFSYKIKYFILQARMKEGID